MARSGTIVPVADPWQLLALPPLDAALLAGLFADLPVEVHVPAERTPDAVATALADVDLVLGDWTGGRRPRPRHPAPAWAVAFQAAARRRHVLAARVPAGRPRVALCHPA